RYIQCFTDMVFRSSAHCILGGSGYSVHLSIILFRNFFATPSSGFRKNETVQFTHTRQKPFHSHAFLLLFWLPLGTPRIAHYPVVETLSDKKVKLFTNNAD